MRITKKHSLIIILIIFFSGCFIIDNNLGRGYRYDHGGNYYGTNPSISNNGKKIVFGSICYGLGDICIVDIDGLNYQRLTYNASYEGEPKFSNDSKKIVFISERDDGDTGHIYIMDIDGSNQKQITNTKYYDSCPSFSPEGDKIIFNRELAGRNYQIYIINIDGTNEKQLTFNKENASRPRFSPHGNKIIYEDWPEVWSMNIDGSQKTLLIKMMENCGAPSFSSDENKIVFINNRIDYQDEAKSSVEIWIMNREGTEQKQITFTKSYKEFPSFSYDNSKILFFEREKYDRGKGQIRIINVDGTNLRTITNNYCVSGKRELGGAR